MGNAADFSALYFPYATFKNIDNLKTSMLAFKHIYLIFPTEEYSRLGVEVSRTVNKDFRELHWGIDPLRSEGESLLQIVSPSETLHKHEGAIQKSYNFDMNDNSFVQKPEHAALKWNLYEEKIPPSILTWVGEYDPDNPKVLRLPFPAGESIMISHAICASIEKDLMPLTDDRTHFEYFHYRVRRGVRFARDMGVENNPLGRFTQWAEKRQEAFQLLLPSIPANTEIKKIINLRAQLEDELNYYRTKMKKLSFLMANPASTDQEIEQYIKENVKPAYLTLKEKSKRLSGVQIANWRYESIAPKEYFSPRRWTYFRTVRMGMLPAPVGLGMLTGTAQPPQMTWDDIKTEKSTCVLAGPWEQGYT
jgi:hypothetical protein